MDILSIVYEGYKKSTNQYGKCFLLIQEQLFTVPYIYELSVEYEFPICSALTIDLLTTDFCREISEDLLDSYYIAQESGSAFLCFLDDAEGRKSPFGTPRFSETDFEALITDLGGTKIPETSQRKTPDFLLDNIVLELKDIQEESLFDKERQQSISRAFADATLLAIDLDPVREYGQPTSKYYDLIYNSLLNHFKKASKQIKTFKEANPVTHAGIILLNTGMFSLPDQLLRSMVSRILVEKTKTIEFAFVFSQISQSNGFGSIANFYGDFIGNVPENIAVLNSRVSGLISEKMADMVRYPNQQSTIPGQHPISFQDGDQIFYWNPGRLPDPRFA